ncbi:MAG: hypothetical protein M5U23_03840 [Acidimicrobiia bacterium]|nr:hypothetical protein [Acidimicrobiia bacterium]
MAIQAPPEPPILLDDVPESAAPGRVIPKWFIVTAIAAPTTLILLTMSGMLGPLGQGAASMWRIPYLLVANTPTGGDMGAHVLLPKVLLEDLLPSGRILGWSMDWYAGFPAMYFYFPLPALTTAILDLVLPFGVAFKLVTVGGLVALPTCTYFFVKFQGFTRYVAAIAGVAGSLFVFMESYSIFGGNIKSTLAGEFAFSWSFALSILFVGMAVRNYRRATVFDPWAGIVLGLTAMSHVITTIVVVFATIPMLAGPLAALIGDRSRVKDAARGALGLVTSYMVGFGLSAFWSLALGYNVLTGMTTDMGWAPVTNIIGDADPGSPLPGEFVPVLAVGIIGMLWTLFRRDGVGIFAWLTVGPLITYFVIAETGHTILYNARLLPYWYFGIYVFAGIAVALGSVAVARRFQHRRSAVLVAGGIAIVLMVGSAAVSMHDLPGWVKWNYEGYEGKELWGEYEALLETVDELPDGRIMWEINNEMNKYGTPMALMLFPFWSEGHPSMEGVFFESSLTTPFHFLNGAEVSVSPSNAVRGLRYHHLDRPIDARDPEPFGFDRGVPHLGMYNVKYYVSYTEEAQEAAIAYGLPIIAESPPWTIFQLPETNLIDVAEYEPVVWAGEGDFVDAALEWYDDIDNLDQWLVEDGPPEWRRVTSVDERLEDPRPYDITGTATVTSFDDLEVGFTTNAVGIPHMVKVSYFPNWKSDGADGVYRVAPSLMMVIPTQSDVELQFTHTWVENLGTAITIFTIVGLIGYAVVQRRKKKAVV